MSKPTIEEREFARLLEGAQAPRGLDERRMRALVAAIERQRSSSQGPAPMFASALRERLVAEARVVAEAEAAARIPVRERLVLVARARTETWRRSFRMAAATGMAAMLLLGSGAALASSRGALPGEWNYGIKRAHEGARMTLTRGDLSRGYLNLDLARRRLGEVAGMSRAGTTAGSLYVKTLDDMDGSTVTGSELLVEASLDGAGLAPVTTLSRFAIAQRLRLERLLDRLPTSVQPAARDSIAVLTKVNERALAVAAGCDCPENPLEPVVKSGSVAQGGVGCACEKPSYRPGGPSAGGDDAQDPSEPRRPTPGTVPESPAPDEPTQPGTDLVPGTDADEPVNDVADSVSHILDGLGLPLPSSLPTGGSSVVPVPSPLRP